MSLVSAPGSERTLCVNRPMMPHIWVGTPCLQQGQVVTSYDMKAWSDVAVRLLLLNTVGPLDIVNTWAV